MAACAQCGSGPLVKGNCPDDDCHFSAAERRRLWIRGVAAGIVARHPQHQGTYAFEAAKRAWDSKPEDC